MVLFHYEIFTELYCDWNLLNFCVGNDEWKKHGYIVEQNSSLELYELAQ